MCYLDPRLLLGPAEARGDFTFNDSPGCFPAQDSFAIHLILLVAAHYCKGHAFLLGRDMGRDLLNPFQRAAASLFPIHLSSSQLTKHKAFCKDRVSPEQHFTGCSLHPAVLSLALWALDLQMSLHPLSSVGSLQQCQRLWSERQSFSIPIPSISEEGNDQRRTAHGAVFWDRGWTSATHQASSDSNRNRAFSIQVKHSPSSLCLYSTL